jgi:hypothetical protein
MRAFGWQQINDLRRLTNSDEHPDLARKSPGQEARWPGPEVVHLGMHGDLSISLCMVDDEPEHNDKGSKRLTLPEGTSRLAQ